MISPEILKLVAEKGIESGALNPKGGEIPAFADKTFSEVDHDVPSFEKDSNIPTFAKGEVEIPRFADDKTRIPEFVDEEIEWRADENEADGAPVKSNYINMEGLSKHLPRSEGTWTGEEGNSVWQPDPDYVPQKGNPEGKTWGEILDKYDIDGIPFHDGEPDFSEVAEAEVQVDEIGTERDENFAKADEALAEKWTEEGKDGREWTAEDVRAYRKENHLTWHECGDRTTMQLVPAEVHSNVPHSGGVSAAKAESVKSGTAESPSANAVVTDGTSVSNNANKA